tara:strand:- start:117 stop:719 length:603 start_codon:yes stop_codon:yes gene_type:complete
MIYALLLFTFFVAGVDANTSTEKQQTSYKPQIFMTEKELALMIDFTEPDSLDSWRITNDGVMGGKSKGQLLWQQGTAIFAGYISLDNNGGFSSVFHPTALLASELDTVTINVAGDGLTYQLRMIVKLDGYRLAYKHDFNTVAGQKETLSFKLADFQASFRGRIISDAPRLQSKEIREVGFLVTRKVAGAFSLAISSISFN